MQRIEKNVTVRGEVKICSLGFWTSGLSSHRKANERNPLLESPAMPQRSLFRFLLLAGLSLAAGFLALAVAVPIEPQLPAPLIALFSPGLKLAELIMPETHKSMAWTFGWFLRIAIAANAAFYFALFALLAYIADRRRLR
jgi:hypothetical protein